MSDSDQSPPLRGTPCTYLLLPTGPPSPPSGCAISDLTYSSLMVRLLLETPPPGQVSCDPLPEQSEVQLVLEVQVSTTGATLRHLSSSGRQLAVGDMRSGAAYTLLVWHRNNHGDSSPVELVVTTLVEPIKQMAETKMAGPPQSPQETGGAALLLAVALAIGLIATVLTAAGMAMARYSLPPFLTLPFLRRGRSRSPLSCSTTVSTSLLREPDSVEGHGLTTISEDVQELPPTPPCGWTVHQSVVGVNWDPLQSPDHGIRTPPPGYRGSPQDSWGTSGV